MIFRNIIFLLILILFSSLSCYDGLNDIYDDLEMKVPICVNSLTGNDANDGRGWRNAVATIYKAYSLAETGDEIWLAGTFTIANPYGLVITKPVTVRGGFTGKESRAADRDPDNKSVINGTADPAVDIKTEGAVVSRISFNSKSLGLCIRITGGVYSATVQECDFTSNFAVPIFTNSGSLYIKNCSFNTNTTNRAISTSGGKITITDTVFKNNGNQNVENGGVIYTTSGNIKITGGSFENNSTTNGAGGVIYCSSSSRIELNGTLFKDNTAGGNYHGGAIFSDASTIVISDCEFNGNIVNNTGYSGGAIYSTIGSDVSISGSTFVNNKSIGGNGGAIYSNNSKFVVQNSVFHLNSSSSPGGALFIWGENTSESPFIVVNTSFSNNTVSSSTWGGAISISESTDTPELYMSNCTFYNNSSASVTNSGSLFLINVTLTIYNTLFYGNSGNYSIDGGTAVLYNNAWDKGENCTGSPLNTQALTSSPFISTLFGDVDFLKPASGTLCIDKGTSSISIPGFTMPSTDLAGNPRIVGTIDIGCYERQ